MQLKEEHLRNLLIRGLAGDAPAYRLFLGDLSVHLRSFLRSRLAQRPEEVEDLVQELLLSIHNQRHTYDCDQPLTAWVHAIARYKFIDYLRCLGMILGESAARCPFLIALIAVPVLIAYLWILRALAPTHLRSAGAAAGLAAGSIGAFVYSLHCPELAAPFIGIWYLLGMLIPMTVGAMFGPRLLRW